MIARIEDDHTASARSYIHNTEIFKSLVSEIKKECAELKLDLAAAQRIGESPGFADRIISRGEILSSRFMQTLLKDRGIDTKFVDLSEVIRFKVPHGLDEQFYQHLAETLAKKVEACGEQVPVITGYFGPVPGGLLSQIGRGYTDLCAALVAVGLRASELEIWKEVDGVFTAVILGSFSREQRSNSDAMGVYRIHVRYLQRHYFLVLVPLRQQSLRRQHKMRSLLWQFSLHTQILRLRGYSPFHHGAGYTF